MFKISNSKNYIWSFPLVAGILTIIGLLTPSSASGGIEIFWTGWFLGPVLFIGKIIPFTLFVAIAVLSIILAVKLRKEDDFRKFERKWLLYGILFIIISILYLIEVEVLMYYYFLRNFGLIFSYWGNIAPGFAVIAPFISGFVILIGFVVNRYVIDSEEKGLIIRVIKIYRNVIYSFVVVFVILLIGVSISFVIYKSMPGDPVLAYLSAMGIHSPSPAQYRAVERALGLDLHIIFQFFKYIGDFFIGNWKISIVTSGAVTGLIIQSMSRMAGLLFLPLIIGLAIGMWLGKFSYKYRGRWIDKLIQIFSALSISIPVFFLGMVVQFFLGFKLNIFSPIGNYVMPMFIMTLAIIALITWQNRSRMINKPYETSVFSNTIRIAKLFGLIFMFYLLLDVAFNLGGLGQLIVESILLYDYYTLTGALFGLIIIFVIVILISFLLFSYNKYRSGEILNSNFELKVDNDIDKRIDIQYEESIKVYILRRLKSPIFIVGLILVLIPIIIAIFPQLFTQYSFDETMGLYAGSWNPPSPGHLFGQTQFGRDVYARILYGVRNSLVLGVGATIIGLIGGVNIGFVAGKFKRGGYRPIMSFMLLFYILPSFLFVLLFISILGRSFFISLISIGIFMIPSFTIATANAMSGELNRKTIGKIGKSLINYIPLNIALAILIYTSIGFIGFSDPLSIQLGGEINIGRSNPYTAPWASLWPGLTIFLIVASFFILHLGLKGVERKRSRENEFKAE